MSATRLRAAWGWSFVGASVLALLSTSQSYASRRIENLPADWWRLFRTEALAWSVWALLGPLVFVVGPRLPRWRDGRWRAAVAWSAFGLALVVARVLIEVPVARAMQWVPTTMPFRTMLLARFSGTLAPDLVMVGLIFLAFFVVEHQGDLRARRLSEAALESQLAGAQLQALQLQLRPHFLVNALDTVSSLMNDDVPAARKVLTQLGDLLRLSLDRGDQQEVPLKDEVAFMERYADIQRQRFRDRLTLNVDVPPAVERALVPAWLLQPLVENAVRHAVEPRAGPARVDVRARRDAMRLVLEVSDDGPGFGDHDGEVAGVGLANTKRRLEQLYAGRHRMELANLPQGGAVVRVTLPYHTSEESLV